MRDLQPYPAVPPSPRRSSIGSSIRHPATYMMKEAGDNLKWFGEGFDGFPKLLPEDCVEYTIFFIDSKLTESEKREKLRKIERAGLKLTNELTKGFIWQREGVSLRVENDKAHTFLRGRTQYGDSVEDEWLVVYIMRELSIKFPEIWIQIVDTDGQFLLIEAASALPRWLNPEVADYRVWLSNRKLWIIALEDSYDKDSLSRSESKSLCLDEALKIIENHGTQMIHSPDIEAEAFYRLQKYPGQIMGSLHHALVKIPRKLAYILHEDPTYISAAIEAFYLRDPIALQPLISENSGGLIFSPEDSVRVSAKFTKIGYAQLKSQQFDPPKSWAKAWSSKSNLKSQTEGETGLKITCGFEMLMSDPQCQDAKSVREIQMLLDDLRLGEDHLPSDADIQKWDVLEDDEGWLDINFEDFQKELNGQRAQDEAGENTGFGDKAAQDNFRKMIARFGNFLDDDAAGAEGAEYLDEMDEDDDEGSTLSDDSKPASEEEDIDLDEGRLTEMMREMMSMSKQHPITDVSHGGRVMDIVSEREGDKALRQDMEAIEKELRQAGALDLNAEQELHKSRPQPGAINTKYNGTDQSAPSIAPEPKGEDEDLDIDLNLAKNLLESFKSQGGTSGPASNLLGLMGMQMPRDEYERD